MPSQQSPHLSGFLRVKRFSRQAVPSCLLACGIWPSHVWDRFQSLSMRRPCRIARSVRMKERQESERNARPHPGPLPPGEGESFARVSPIGTRWVVVLFRNETQDGADCNRDGRSVKSPTTALPLLGERAGVRASVFPKLKCSAQIRIRSRLCRRCAMSPVHCPNTQSQKLSRLTMNLGAGLEGTGALNEQSGSAEVRCRADRTA